MSEIIGVLIEHGAEFAIIDPALKAATAGGVGLVKDWIGPERLSEIRRVFARASEKLKKRKVDPHKPPLTILLPLLEAAQDEGRDELREIWASLLAAAADPARSNLFRRELIDVAKQLEPLDTVVLASIAKPGRNVTMWRNEVSAELKRGQDEVVLAAQNLERLGCISTANSVRIEISAMATPRGRLLLALIED